VLYRRSLPDGGYRYHVSFPYFLAQLPPFLSPFISNGLLPGVLICILLEQVTKARNEQHTTTQKENQ
jgi:xanthine/uracil permease